MRLRDAARGCLDLSGLEAQAGRARAQAAARAGKLSSVRHEAARRLEQAVESRLAALELPQAWFRVTLGVVAEASGLDLGDGPVRSDGDGVDQVEFRFSSSRSGLPCRSMKGRPAGGCLALALAAAGASDGQPLLVLDEVDTGVGGETAARVGDLLAEIGRERQVLAAGSHRPEIAARGPAPAGLAPRPGTAESRVDRVEADQRVREGRQDDVGTHHRCRPGPGRRAGGGRFRCPAPRRLNRCTRQRRGPLGEDPRPAATYHGPGERDPPA